MQLPKLLTDGLTSAEQSVLIGALETMSFVAGACILHAEEPGDGCYIIEQGEVRLELGNQEHIDTERVLGYLTSGWLLGEMALLDEMPRSASAFAETDVVAHWLSATKLEKISGAYPQISIALSARSAAMRPLSCARATSESPNTFRRWRMIFWC